MLTACRHVHARSLDIFGIAITCVLITTTEHMIGRKALFIGANSSNYAADHSRKLKTAKIA